MLNSQNEQQDQLECEKSPDGKHHYEHSTFQHAVYVHNGKHTCYTCHFCGDDYCKTTTFPEPNPLEFPTKEQLQ